MNLRRNRRHHYGSSNSDYKAMTKKEMARPTGMTALQYLSQPKKKTFREIMEIREKKHSIAPLPLHHTQKFYKVGLFREIYSKRKVFRDFRY